MFGVPQHLPPETIGFLLIPNFSMIAFTSAIEPLRMANRLSGQDLYRWILISKDGGSVTASNQISVQSHVAIHEVNAKVGGNAVSSVIVVSGVEVERHTDRKILAWLRRQERLGYEIGALCTGAYFLARAGLLDGYNCTLHWENLPGFREVFPDINATDDLFEIDRNRFTCSGGMASLDMMLHLIRLQHGSDLAAKISDQCILDRIRGEEDHQRIPASVRFGIYHPKLLNAIRLMEGNLEEPLNLDELATYADLSRRQIERLFARYLNCSPMQYYRYLRLDRARYLLHQTDLRIVEIAIASGFVSSSHFSKCYRDQFGISPNTERRTAA